jgi:hypothetical protein
MCRLVNPDCEEAVREIGGAGTTGCFRLTTIVNLDKDNVESD